METRNIVEIINDEKLTADERVKQVKEYIQNLPDPAILEIPYGKETEKAYGKDTALTAASRLGYADCVRILIESKVNVNAKPKECMLSPLHWAAYEGRPDCLKLLLDAKANVNETDRFGNTALGHASGSGKQKECVTMLLAAGAELNLDSYNDSNVPALYSILLGCDSQTKIAFEALLRLNEKVKLKEEKADKNSIMFMSHALKKDELDNIDKILNKSNKKSPLNSSGFFKNEQTKDSENKNSTRSWFWFTR